MAVEAIMTVKVKSYKRGFIYSIKVVNILNMLRNVSLSKDMRSIVRLHLKILKSWEILNSVKKVLKILAANTNVILYSGGIDDLCLKYFMKAATDGCSKS
ncbi:hypothetical protein PGB90_008112 [Kerria lacca]